MAFTATEKLSIIKITGVDKINLQYVLDLYDSYIDDDTEDAVRDEIARWDDGAGADFVSVEPMEANFGARINPGLAKSDIRANIARLLFLDVAGVMGSTGQLELVRG